MTLSATFVAEHIARWEERLKSPYLPHRAKWPSRLFHHSPLENVVKILTAGVLLSRSDPGNERPFDVAGAGVIDTRETAHDFVRMYFRPNTPTQYHIEGIRRPEECQYGEQAHAPMLVMLLLKASVVLTQPEVMFSNRNMQLGDARHDSSEAFFSEMPFDMVFHEGPTSNKEIFGHRCAEVLATSPLILEDALEAICCRSPAEAETLIYLLGSTTSWTSKIWISDDLKLFGRRFAFVKELTLSKLGVVFAINPRHDRGGIDVRVEVRDHRGSIVINRLIEKLPSVPPQGDKWIIKHDFSDGSYEVRMLLEGKLAYQRMLSVGDVIL
jgi:hypothetical protein